MEINSTLISYMQIQRNFSRRMAKGFSIADIKVKKKISKNRALALSGKSYKTEQDALAWHVI